MGGSSELEGGFLKGPLEIVVLFPTNSPVPLRGPVSTATLLTPYFESLGPTVAPCHQTSQGSSDCSFTYPLDGHVTCRMRAVQY